MWYKTTKGNINQADLITNIEAEGGLESVRPSMVPTNPLQLVSCIRTLRFVPLSMLGSALTCATASSIAGLTTFPITESNVNSAPMRTSAGLAGSSVPFWLAAVVPLTSIQAHISRTAKWAEFISNAQQPLISAISFSKQTTGPLQLNSPKNEMWEQSWRPETRRAIWLVSLTPNSAITTARAMNCLSARS